MDENARTQVAARRPKWLALALLWVCLTPGPVLALTLAPGDVLLSSTVRIDPLTGVQAHVPTQEYRYFSLYDLVDGRPITYLPLGQTLTRAVLTGWVRWAGGCRCRSRCRALFPAASQSTGRRRLRAHERGHLPGATR
jgi:hypothetical protein